MLDLGHKKLKAWQLSFELYPMIIELENRLPRNEKYNLYDQIKRASLSISNNIAEGAARKSSLERKRFYEIA